MHNLQYALISYIPLRYSVSGSSRFLRGLHLSSLCQWTAAEKQAFIHFYCHSKLVNLLSLYSIINHQSAECLSFYKETCTCLRRSDKAEQLGKSTRNSKITSSFFILPQIHHIYINQGCSNCQKFNIKTYIHEHLHTQRNVYHIKDICQSSYYAVIVK